VEYQDFNKNAWSYLVRQKEESTRPYGTAEFKNACYWLDPASWIPWRRIRHVLCLAAGGGQQGPLFASLRMDVTVFDLNPDQLQTDRRTARRHGMTIKCIQGDMTDLSRLHGSNFDLVYQPISSLYVPDIRRVYKEVFKVLRPGGYYWVEHWNPFQMQLAETKRWDGEAYRIVHRQDTGEPLAWQHSTNGESAVSWNYIHSLEALIGGICDAGMVILRFGERHDGNAWARPGSNHHMAAYIPSFYSIFARRPQLRMPTVSGRVDGHRKRRGPTG
jgi:SAM-dependent methyltransferase